MRALAALGLSVLAVAWAGTSADASVKQASLSRVQDLGNYVGQYPCQNGLLTTPTLRKALRSVLASDYDAYLEHMSLSGCGAIERRGGYLLLDVSQLHVGGYSSIILVHESGGQLYLAWLKGPVGEHDLTVYGLNPPPEDALRTFARSLNVSWGHVACFLPDKGTLLVDTARRANQDTGDCLP